jgi:large subunit ribosomal protein L23
MKNMNRPHEIIRQPLLTEKTTILRERAPVYCFRVHPRANKIEIARAVEQLFARQNVKVAGVRTQRVYGKVKRMGRFLGKHPDWKKAWVTLTPDSGEIELFEAP